MGILVLTHPQPAQPFVQAFERLLPDERVFVDRETALAQADQVQAVLLWRLVPGLLAPFGALRFVAASAAGVDKILGPHLPQDLPVTRTIDPEQNLQIAQYVCAMVLRHVRQSSLYDAQQRDRQWKRHPMPQPCDITVGLLGLGESGRVVAGALRALGFSVVGWSRSPKTVPGVIAFEGPQGLTDMLAQCQVLVCLLPLTPETEGLVNARLLAALPPGAFLINVARGAHVVEADLEQALRSGHLAGAALDVQSSEPLPADSSLWEVPGLILTPHVASLPSAQTVVMQVAENLQRARRNEPLLRVVDRTRGY
jgi:phosphoglycerate dehydrogenase-like enzyme